MYTACEVANAQLGLAQLYDHPNRASLRRTADALQAYGRAESVYRDLLLRTDVLAQLDRQAAPGDASSEGYLLHQIATIHGGRALLHLQQEDPEAAAREVEVALQLRRRNIDHEPQLVYVRAGLLTESTTGARILLRLGQAQAALEASTLAWAELQELAREEGPASKWAGAAMQALVTEPHGRALLANHRVQEALELLAVCQQHWQAQGTTDEAGAHGAARVRLAAVQLAQAEAMAQLQRPEESLQLATRVLKALQASGEARPATGDDPTGRAARLLQAEAHALLSRLLSRLQPGAAQAHRQAAIQALLAAQAWQPPGRLGADQERQLAALQGGAA